MAVVPTNFALGVSQLTRLAFASPGVATSARTPMPIARCVFRRTGTVALKDAANESIVTWTVTLTPKFIYRIAHFSILATSTGISVFDDWEKAMTIGVNEDGVSVLKYPLVNGMVESIGADGYKVDDDAATNDFGTFFHNGGIRPGQLLINAIKSGIITATWVDSSSDATAATVTEFLLVLDQFTPAQWNAAPLHTSVLNYPI